MYTHFIHTFRGGSMILLTNNAKRGMKLIDLIDDMEVKSGS